MLAAVEERGDAVVDGWNPEQCDYISQLQEAIDRALVVQLHMMQEQRMKHIKMNENTKFVTCFAPTGR